MPPRTLNAHACTHVHTHTHHTCFMHTRPLHITHCYKLFFCVGGILESNAKLLELPLPPQPLLQPRTEVGHQQAQGCARVLTAYSSLPPPTSIPTHRCRRLGWWPLTHLCGTDFVLFACVCLIELVRNSVCVCVCVCVRERERERDNIHIRTRTGANVHFWKVR